MKRQHIRLWMPAAIAAVLLASLSILAQNVPQWQLTYREAQTKQQLGDLEGAMKLYDEVVASKDADRTVKADALLQKAAYYKLIGKPSEDLHRQIVRDFPGTPAAAKAAAELPLQPPTQPVARTRPGIFIGDIDLVSGTIQNVRPITRDAAVTEQHPKFSPDGKSIAFVRIQGAGAGEVVVRSLETGKEIPVPGAYRSNFTVGPGGPIWSHDSKSILHGSVDSDTVRIGRYDLATGTVTRLIEYPAFSGVGNVAISSDGKTLYASGFAPRAVPYIPTFIAIDLTTERQKHPPVSLPATQRKDLYVHRNMSLSPDDTVLAFHVIFNQTNTKIVRIGADGTAYKELLTLGFAWGAPIWSPDGRQISFFATVNGRASAANNPWALVRMPAEGGKPEFTGLEVAGLAGFDLSPDGKRIVFGGTTSSLTKPGPYENGFTSVPPPPNLPAAPPCASPAVTFSAAATTVNSGQSTKLVWSSQSAVTVLIEPGIGPVSATGSRDVTPQESVTYTAVAVSSCGGAATAAARVTVNPTLPR